MWVGGAIGKVKSSLCLNSILCSAHLLKSQYTFMSLIKYVIVLLSMYVTSLPPVVCLTCSEFHCEPCGQSFQYQSQYNKHVASRSHITFVEELSGFMQPVENEEV